MIPKFITISAIGAASALCFVSCKEKSEEVKQVEEATAKAVESGAMTKEQAEKINEAAQQADDLQEQGLKLAKEHLAKLEEAGSPDELKAAIKDATKASVDMSVKAGVLTREQAEMAQQSLSSLDLLPEDQLNVMAEQLKAQFKTAIDQAK